MVASALEIYSYIRAPRLTFALKHPGKALKMARTRWDMKHAYAPRIAAAGAALLALPAGYAAGRVRRSGGTVGRGLAAALIAMPIGYLLGRMVGTEKRSQARSARWRREGAPQGRGRELSEPRQPAVVSRDDGMADESARPVEHPSSLTSADGAGSMSPLGRSAGAPVRPTRAGVP